MNGITNDKEISLSDRRPIITCAGELEVFSSLEDLLSQALPKDSYEWERAKGRPIRSVHVAATFIPFSANALPKGNQWDLIRQPLFHVYWTECTDMDLYKTNVRDDIETWLKEINSREITDWLIVVVENYDGKRVNKLLPRTTVLDKIRADFAPKQGDRCISVINPGRVESRSADSWRGLVARVRHLVLHAYAPAVMRFEEHIRQQREKRNEPGWSFMQYFKLQEELAQVLEMLGLYDEALVQYDELDALFSQFIVNGNVGDVARWISGFQRPLERWHGLKLGPCKLNDDPSLLELRAYLFAKQAHMLLLTNKIWEMASRCLPFLHTSARELILLDINPPAGAVSCWLFLACVEVLQICDEHNQTDQVEEYSVNTAPLWAYASQKLHDLGQLCGLLPGQSPSYQQLHTVVGLSAGMGDCPGLNGKLSPTDKLKKALSSQEAFNKHYLELAELAVGTYKHISHIRSARLIGREVAAFYILLGEMQKAAAFLTDALKTFQLDGWHELAAQTHLELAECYRKAGDKRKFIRSCAAVSAAPEIDNLIRWSYFDEMQKNLDSLEKPLIVPFDNIIKIISISVKNNGNVMQDCNIDVELVVDSNFPREILCTNVVISLESEKELNKVKSVENGRTISCRDMKYENQSLRRLKIHRQLDYKQDKQLSSASIFCKTEFPKRKDSCIPPIPSSFEMCLELNTLPLVLTPGINIIRLTKLANTIGKFYLGKVAIHINNLNLISLNLSPKFIIDVKREEPVLRLDKGVSALLSGIEQTMKLSLTVGSYEIPQGSIIKVTTSRGLTVQHDSNNPLSSSLEISIDNTLPFSVTQMDLRVFSELQYKEHQVTLVVPWVAKPILVLLSFTPLLSTSWRLHSTAQRKFVHVNVTSQSEKRLELLSPYLEVKSDVKVISLNVPDERILIAGTGISVSFVWEIPVDSSTCNCSLKALFSIEYIAFDCTEEDSSVRSYSYNFEIVDYQTLYIVESGVEPTKGNEFCRVSALCNLNLCIKRICNTTNENDSINSLMYEVLAEQSIWAVCGRTAGVVTFQTDYEPKTILLQVMPLNTGYLPLPLIRLSKYIPADTLTTDKPRKSVEAHPRLCPFNPGQVYNTSKGQQVHVIAAATNDGHVT